MATSRTHLFIAALVPVAIMTMGACMPKITFIHNNQWSEAIRARPLLYHPMIKWYMCLSARTRCVRSKMSLRVGITRSRTSINSSFRSMVVRSAMASPWSTAAKDAFNKIGSKFTNLNAPAKCQRPETLCCWVMCKELRHRHLSSRSRTTAPSWRPSSSAWSYFWAILQKMTWSSYRRRKLRSAKGHMAKFS